MKIQYKVSYLSDGTKVHITPRLFNQLKKWEMDDISIADNFADILKQQDHEWLRSLKCYYTHNKSLDTIFDSMYPNLYRTYPVEKAILSREFFSVINTLLSKCTITQQRRFILHYYYGLSNGEIAIRENVCKGTVQKSLIQAWETIRNNVF